MNKSTYLGLSTLLLASCQSYKKLELTPDSALSQLEQQRTQDLPDSFSFHDAVKLMDKNNLELQQIRKEYETLQQVADIGTPWPNPVITAGPAFGSESGLSDTGSAYPFVGIGFSIPLGPRLRRNDDLNRLKALKAYNEQVLTHRQLFFDLKQAWVNFSLDSKFQLIQEKMTKSLELTTRTAEQLQELGSSTRLGVNGIKLRQADLQLQKLEQGISSSESVESLSRLLVVDEEQVLKLNVADLAEATHRFSLVELKGILLTNNPDLARTEMDFQLKDAELRLELAKQYPDLEFGFDAEEEVGETTNTFSFPFSLELPLFDRNQQAIKASTGARDTALTEYNKQLNNQLTRLAKLFKQHSLAQQKVKFLESKVLPLSRSQIKDARTSLKIGAIDVLRYLDILNESLQVELQHSELKRQAWRYFLELQSLVGQPLNEENEQSFIKTPFKSTDQNHE
ncbi:TolC family protein [Lentisphaera marina]|uniref:TolC family protein n=1 Tax=Lentisphaera marina TaxID=1111041 RepID=UPI0023662EDF|nr:TolC family protein [Lentisphaera marina]MDD7984351.1 TolC family protein [Lentisphaera marina]